MRGRISFQPDGRIFLHPDDGSRRKHIGSLAGQTLVTWKKEEHRHQATNSFGFDRRMIEKADFEVLRVKYSDGPPLETTKKFLLAQKDLRQYRNEEEQYFLRLDLFGLDKARSYEQEEAKRRKRNPTMWDILGIERPKHIPPPKEKKK